MAHEEPTCSPFGGRRGERLNDSNQVDCPRGGVVASVGACCNEMGEIKEGKMGDYVSVKCEKCKEELAAEFFDYLEKPMEVWVPLCENCFEKERCSDCNVGYDEGYEVGYEDGLAEGKDKGYDTGYDEGYNDGSSEEKPE